MPLNERLVLRRGSPSDRSDSAASNADPDTMRYMPRYLTRAEGEAYADLIVAEFERDGVRPWAVATRRDGRLSGMTGTNRVPFDASFTPAVEIGWRFAAREFSGGSTSAWALASRLRMVR